MGLQKLVAGNWKMHGLSTDLAEIEAIAAASRRYPMVDVALCVPTSLIERAVRSVPGFAVGAQDVHHAATGAHTGCTSALMVQDAGAVLTIVGHSERRESQRESDGEIKAKAEAALSIGLTVILCVGEALEIRERGRAIEFVMAQLEASAPASMQGEAELAIAYEPIWAIGTGNVPSSLEIREMHAAIRSKLIQLYGSGGETVRILYGGSVKPGNAKEIFAIADVNGALVGGASLAAADFIPIIAAATGD